MVKKSNKAIRLSENDLKQIINESVYSVISENLENEKFLGINFGKQERKDNRMKTFEYARLYKDLVVQVEAISNELCRRAKILDDAQAQEQQTLNEGVLGSIGKAIARVVTNIGGKLAAKGAGKKAFKWMFRAGLAEMVAEFCGIPQAVSDKIAKFKHPGQTQPSEVIEAYAELAQWMQELCEMVKENPLLLGSVVLSDEVKNGPQQPKGEPFMTGGEVAGFAISCGLYCLGPWGVAAGLVFDAIDIAAMFVSAGAKRDKEGLKMVEQQYKYITAAIKEINESLAATTNPAFIQQVAGQQQQQAQGQQEIGYDEEQFEKPSNYIIGRPAPFVTNPDEYLDEVARFQNYLNETFGCNIPVTGVWNDNRNLTQTAWDLWLQKTYGQPQAAQQQSGVLGESAFKDYVKKIIMESIIR